MIVVLDSNVWVAALVASGTCQEMVRDAVRLCEVVISPVVMREVDRALAGAVGATPRARVRVRRWLEAVCQVMEPPPRHDVACRDPHDLPILWLALAAHADLLVTGDRDLLALAGLQGIRIVPPARFWHEL